MKTIDLIRNRSFSVKFIFFLQSSIKYHIFYCENAASFPATCGATLIDVQNALQENGFHYS